MNNQIKIEQWFSYVRGIEEDSANRPTSCETRNSLVDPLVLFNIW